MAILILTLIIINTFVLASCENDKNPAETGDQSSSNVQTADRQYRPAVPEGISFNGSDFQVLSMDPELYPSTLVDFDFEEDPGDGVAAAIFTRNRRIEAEYDIVFQSDYGAIEEMSPALVEQAMTGDDYYKLIMLISREAFPQSLDGNVIPYSTIPYVDMTQPWYMSEVNDAFSIYGYNVLAYTDECMNAYMQSMCVFFNMNIVKDNNDLENPYDLVEDGAWTLDEFYSLATAAKRDVNGDNVWSAADGDVYGVISEGDAFYPAMWVGSETYTIVKDKRGIPAYTAYEDEKFIGILSQLRTYLTNDGFFCSSWEQFSDVQGGGDSQRNAGLQYFAQGGGLFRVGCVGQIQLLRDMESDFGIVPLPKYDEKQEKYYSRTVDGWIHVAPVSVLDTEMLGVIIEALGAETKNLVIPEFFDIALNYKYVREEDIERTKNMLDMIFDNAVMDLGETIWMDYIRNPILTLLDQKQDTFVSTLTSIRSSVQEKCINETIESIIELQKEING